MTTKLLNLAAPAMIVAALALPSAPALAATQPAACSVSSTGTNTTNQSDSKFTSNPDVVTGKFEVTGAADCRVQVTITTWQAPNGAQGKPYSEQKLFDHFTGTYGPGKHTITTQMPHCYFQVDLLRGDQATAPDGSPIYPSGWLMGSLHGGTQKCESTPTPTPTPTPVPTPTPTPVQPEPAPQPEVLPAQTQPAALPQTGSAMSGLVGLTAMAGAGYMYLRKRRNASL